MPSANPLKARVGLTDLAARADHHPPSLLAITFVSLQNHSPEEDEPPTASQRELMLLLGLPKAIC